MEKIPFINHLRSVEKETGSKIYLVGGTVRDFVLKRESSDVDIVGFGIDYKELAKSVAEKIRCRSVFFKDNVRLVKKGFILDISKPRGKNIEEDLKFRDLTINNLAMSLEGKIIGNDEDIIKKKLRFVSEESVDDDPLRILRVFRFASELGFYIDKSSFDIINSKRNQLNHISSERIYAELKKTVTSDYFLNIYHKMLESGIFDILIPELDNLKGIYPGIYHSKEPYEHTLCVAENIYQESIKEKMDKEAVFILFFTGILHDIAKGCEDYKKTPGKFIDHEEKGASMAVNILRRLNFPNNEINLIKLLIENHTKIRIYATQNAKERTLKKFIYNFHEILNYLFIITIGDNACKPHNLQIIKDTIQKIKTLEKQMDFSKKDLINGNDVISLGYEKGPIIKKILDDVKFRLVNVEISDKNATIKYIVSNYKLT